MMYKRSQQIGTLAQVLKFSCKTTAKFPNVVRGVIGQAGVFDIRPDLLVRIEFRCIGRKFFRDNFRMLSQIRPHHPGTIMYSTAVPDNGKGAGKMALKLTQKSDHILSVNILIVCQQGEVQSPAFTNGTDGDGTNGRDTVPSIPAVVNGCLPSRSQGSSNGRSEHETRFIGENQVSASTSSVFLSAEILCLATEQFLSRRVRGRGVRVFDWSNPNVASECCGRVRGEVLCRNAGESPRLHEEPSIGCCPSHALGRLLTEVSPIAVVARRPVAAFGREAAWRTSPSDPRAPCPTSDTATDEMPPESGRLQSATRPLASVAPHADDGVPTLLRFLLVSYIWYRLISSRHLRKTGVNNNTC